MSARRIKTIFTLLLTLTLVCSSAVQAQDATTATTTTTTSDPKAATPTTSENYLKKILANVNKLPIYLRELTKMAISWLEPDNSNATATLQNSFTTLASARLANVKTQLESQEQFFNSFAGQTSLAKQAEINYKTLLHSNKSPSIGSPAYTYALYATGLNIKHAEPEIRWRDSPANTMYTNYYNTASAVQTYNGYILSELYADVKNNNRVQTTQDSLVQQASNSDWFTQIASENIGVVLRQILLYNSQTYVLLTQLLETQKKLLTSQTMNNALLLAVSQETENHLYSKAAGKNPI